MAFGWVFFWGFLLQDTVQITEDVLPRSWFDFKTPHWGVFVWAWLTQRPWYTKAGGVENPSSCRQPRNTKIATFGKSPQISTELPKLIKSLCVIKKEADLTFAEFLR
jgi:hypothetical protein